MVAVILIALVALGVVVAVAWPLLTDRGPDAASGADAVDGRADLQDEIDRSLRAIREIEFDHQAGNISDADFAELDRAERAHAAELLKRRDGPVG